MLTINNIATFNVSIHQNTATDVMRETSKAKLIAYADAELRLVDMDAFRREEILDQETPGCAVLLAHVVIDHPAIMSGTWEEFLFVVLNDVMQQALGAGIAYEAQRGIISKFKPSLHGYKTEATCE